VAQKLAPDVAAGELAGSSAIRAAVQNQVDAVNATLARVEQIKKFTILPQPFSVAGGELTPTMKLKRKVIAQRYETQINAMYTDGD
jgi:long-chain acyl-CoA synthetase